MKRVLITGSTAFVGSHLADRLTRLEGYEVHGLKRARSPELWMNDKVTYHVGDITDQTAMSSLIEDLQPEYIYHLAAQSFVPLSWEAPTMTLQTNVNGSLNILEAVRQHSGPNTRVVMAGTSEEYGYVTPDECPITEHQPLRPFSPYGASKVAMDLLCQVYAKSYDMQVMVTRAFNHTGPRRGQEFVTSKIARQLAMIYLGQCEPVIELGNTGAVRDFSDARDIVRAYLMVAELGTPGEVYNIGSGNGRPISNVLDTLVEISGLQGIEIQHNAKFMRPADVPLLVCDSTKIRQQIGWEPKIEFNQTMTDLYNYWLERLSP